MTAASRGSRGGLEESWEDTAYASDGAELLESVSEYDSQDDASESDLDGPEHERDDMATPLPQRVTRASSRTPQDTPVKTPNRYSSRQSPKPRSTPRSQPRFNPSTPGSNLEPSLIMPSMYGSSDFSNGSPLRNSQMRARKAHRSSNMDPANRARSSPQSKVRRASARTSIPQHRSDTQPPQTPWALINKFVEHVAWPVVQYFLGIGGMVLDFLKPLFAGVLLVYLVILLLSQASALINSGIRSALTPACLIPGSSYILPFCSSVRPTPTETPDFDALVDLQSSFEDILKDNQDSHSLPATMKQGELAIRDLKTVVRWSKLPSRSELEVEFDTFIAMAKEASKALIDYNTRIGGTVDKVIHTNKWTINMLEGYTADYASRGLIGQMASLNPLSVFAAPSPTLQQKVFDQYLKHVSSNKEDLESVIQMGQSLAYLLASLEDRLDIIGNIATRDNFHVSANRDELLSQLWTKLGGNSATRKGFEKSLQLLKDIGTYRKDAQHHVAVTLIKLQEISAGMEDLREHVAAPEVLGFRDEWPVERYLDLVRGSLERLADARGEQLRVERQTYARSFQDVGDRGTRELPAPPVKTAKSKSAGNGKNM